MEVISVPAKNVYSRIPDNFDPEKEVPVKIVFGLEDLTHEKGYVNTPMDDLFRNIVQRLDIPIHKIDLHLPRSGGFPLLFGSEPLRFLSDRGNELHYVQDERLRPFVEYQRHLFRGSVVYDSLDSGESDLKTALRFVWKEPEGETLIVGIENTEIKVHTGYDFEKSFAESIIARDRKSGFRHELVAKFSVPWLAEEKYGKPELVIKRKKSEEIVAVAKDILYSYISHHNF